MTCLQTVAVHLVGHDEVKFILKGYLPYLQNSLNSTGIMMT